jgi:hypothetical protein
LMKKFLMIFCFCLFVFLFVYIHFQLFILSYLLIIHYLQPRILLSHRIFFVKQYILIVIHRKHICNEVLCWTNNTHYLGTVYILMNTIMLVFTTFVQKTYVGAPTSALDRTLPM